MRQGHTGYHHVTIMIVNEASLNNHNFLISSVGPIMLIFSESLERGLSDDAN